MLFGDSADGQYTLEEMTDWPQRFHCSTTHGGNLTQNGIKGVKEEIDV